MCQFLLGGHREADRQGVARCRYHGCTCKLIRHPVGVARALVQDLCMNVRVFACVYFGRARIPGFSQGGFQARVFCFDTLMIDRPLGRVIK